MKWPYCKDFFVGTEIEIEDNSFNFGFYNGVEACRNIFNEACGREALAKVIKAYLNFVVPQDNNGVSFEVERRNFYIAKSAELADAIRRHLGLEKEVNT